MKLEIINLRRNIFKYLKNKALNFEGGISIEMKKYRLDQEASSTREFYPTEIDELKEKNYIKIYRTGCFLFNNYVQIWFLIEYIGEDRLNQYIKIIEQSCNCKIIEQLSFY